jgi:3-methyladenine DNA glycosylase AlkC
MKILQNHMNDTKAPAPKRMAYIFTQYKYTLPITIMIKWKMATYLI